MTSLPIYGQSFLSLVVNPVTIKLASRSGTNKLAKQNFCYPGKHNSGEAQKELNCNILTNCGLVMA